MARYVRVLIAAVLLGIVIGGSYTAGYLSGTRTYSATLLPPALSSATSTDKAEQFKVFWEAWDLVEKEFYDRTAVNATEMTYGAIAGMLASLKDPHTAFASPSISSITDEDMKGSFDGIGVNVEMKDGLVTVVTPIEGSPGEAAGIKPGDVIVKVDGRDTTTLPLLEVVALIRGPRDSVVELTLIRAGEPEPLVIRVKRAEIVVESVMAKMLDHDIAYVKLTSFAEPTADLLAKRLNELMAANPKGLILDLRNNPGGLLDAAVDVTSQFISEGVVLYQQSRDTEKMPHYAKSGGVATSIPMAVLINKGSASASEITAGALQDVGRAKLIGEPSFGKDTVQNVHRLSDNSTVRVTISKWLTPKEQPIHDTGLRPDIVVPLTEEDYEARRDPQLDRAVEYVRQLTPVTQLSEPPARGLAQEPTPLAANLVLSWTPTVLVG